jgi:hypothetical protein
MTRRVAFLLFGAVLLVVAAALIWLGLRRQSPEAPEPATVAVEPGAEAGGEPVSVDLYLPGEDGLLAVETRVVAAPASGPERAQVALATLLAVEPITPGLFAPFAPPLAVNRVELGAGAVLYVSLEGPQLPPAAGSLVETLRIWSLVETALAAAPEARSVVLVWNGAQPESLGGHIDTRRPLGHRDDLVRR